MAEPSIEEKAKAYDEALERAKNTIEVNQTIPNIVECVESLFPVLKESEDEGIMKAILIYLDWLDGKIGYEPKGEYSIRDMIAWLEKKSEQKSVEDIAKEVIKDRESAVKFLKSAGIMDSNGELAKEYRDEQILANSEKTCKDEWKEMRLEVYQQASGNRHEPNCSDGTTKMFSLNDIDEIIDKISEQKTGDKVTRNDNVELVNLSQLNRVAKKQGEQKTPEESLGISSKEWNDIVDECLYGEQKPALDIEIPFGRDSELIEETIAIPEGCYAAVDDDKIVIHKGEKPAAWSKEDEAMWAQISELLWEGYKLSASKFSWDDIRNWVSPKLKSLKDRYAWKPSDEQMEMLERVSKKENFIKEELECIRGYREVAKKRLEKLIQKEVQKTEGSFVNVDDVRDDFVNEVYRVLDADPTNDRANQIIYAFDNLPTVELIKQKPVIKEEPKFHKDDWIIFNGWTLHIDEVASGYYIATTKEGVRNTCVGRCIDASARPWTIQDAKDGDVLCCNQMIILFKHCEREYGADYCVIAHAGVDMKGKLQFTNGSWRINNNSQPATKEQRDLLFSKIKEAGYEWDAEKKELKKIGQKPAWSEEDDIMVHDIDNALRCQIIYSKSKLDFMSSWIDSLKERVQPQPKQEWSEEDNNALKVITQVFEVNGIELLHYPAFIHWLKTLPNRITPQNTWKPSEEQMEALNDVISSRDIKYDVLSELWEDLKKLREE